MKLAGVLSAFIVSLFSTAVVFASDESKIEENRYIDNYLQEHRYINKFEFITLSDVIVEDYYDRNKYENDNVTSKKDFFNWLGNIIDSYYQESGDKYLVSSIRDIVRGESIKSDNYSSKQYNRISQVAINHFEKILDESENQHTVIAKRNYLSEVIPKMSKKKDVLNRFGEGFNCSSYDIGGAYEKCIYRQKIKNQYSKYSKDGFIEHHLVFNFRGSLLRAHAEVSM